MNRPDFAVLTPAHLLTERELERAIRAFARFYNSVTHRHQRRSRFALLQSSAAQGVLAQKLFAKMDLPAECLLGDEADWSDFEAILMLPMPFAGDSARIELLRMGLPVIAFDGWERVRSFDAGFAIFVPQALEDQAVREFSGLIRMLYFDPAAIKMLRQKAAVFARRSSSAFTALA